MLRRSSRKGISAHQVTKALGWLSVGIGVVQVLNHRRLSRTLGMREKHGLIRAAGLREIASGAAILVSPNPTPWIWTRVAGDVFDLAALGSSAQNRTRRRNIMLAIAAVSAVTALDIFSASKENGKKPKPVRLWHPYHERSGFPRTPKAMRGIARDIEMPEDMMSFEFLQSKPRMITKAEIGSLQQPI